MTKITDKPHMLLSERVHYVMRDSDFGTPVQTTGPQHRAAVVVTDAGRGLVTLLVFAAGPGDGLSAVGFQVVNTQHSEFKEPGTWHWPEVEEAL